MALYTNNLFSLFFPKNELTKSWEIPLFLWNNTGILTITVLYENSQNWLFNIYDNGFLVMPWNYNYSILSLEFSLCQFSEIVYELL